MTIRRTLQITLRVLLTPLGLLWCTFFLAAGWPFMFTACLLGFAIKGTFDFKEYMLDEYWIYASLFLRIIWGQA